MTQYLLDADVVIDYLLGKDPGRQMVAHLFGSTLHLSVLAWAEVEYGIEGGQNQEHFQKSFREMLVNANINLLPVDNAIVKKFVPLKLFLEKKGQKISDFDLLIASTALVYDLTLATRNKRHFSRIPRLQLL